MWSDLRKRATKPVFDPAIEVVITFSFLVVLVHRIAGACAQKRRESVSVHIPALAPVRD
jgi:hypothetical protein